jgi:hypothetical protein
MPILRFSSSQTGNDGSAGFRTATAVSTSAFDRTQPGAHAMLDVIFIIGGLAFFAISVGYTIICERL